ncbi:Phosphatidylinositol N-acetylglucosaminyltransferase gpi3 subunit [Diplonema papillatum]|nr:Phosphatidylinositol N-acetylglucosaminyltransferase gpi3 subunit [Diplonema papillatum]
MGERIQLEAGRAAPARRYKICLVSDFFFPGFGGVETHIFCLAWCLKRAGHRVVIVTRAYNNDRQGIRCITGGVKVYYLPLYSASFPHGVSTLPTTLDLLPWLRHVFIRESVDIVHGHQTTSNMCQEAMFHATTMGIPTVFTDHSLFGFADASSIHINKVLEWSLQAVQHVICVSHTARENTVLRAKKRPSDVSVIPNAVDPAKFQPEVSIAESETWRDIFERQRRSLEKVTVVVITRLVYRKGADLLVDVIPSVCAKHPNVDWIVGGDGPRLLQIEQMIEMHNLHDKVELLGAVKHDDVPGVLRRGQIFLNASLTESFCIAILEAAASGRVVVATEVGGVPEVLPSDLLILAPPDPKALADGVTAALGRFPSVSPWAQHRRVAAMYNWEDITARTMTVYAKVADTPPPPLHERICHNLALGLVYGCLCAGITALHHFVWLLLKFVSPADGIQKAPELPAFDDLDGTAPGEYGKVRNDGEQ